MSAHYDKFDYPTYWIGREYEHKAEVIAIASFLSKIKNINTLLEVGAGYGRLTPTYLHRAKKIFLSDPSSKLLSAARKSFQIKKIKFLHCSLQNLFANLNRKRVDVLIMVRVSHHLIDINKSFRDVFNLLNPKGYLILEFPNKIHWKSVMKELSKGNFTVFYDIFPKDIRSKSSIKKKSIQFNNFHPGYILEHLRESGFEILEVRSVSNIRNTFLKKHIPFNILCQIEGHLQYILSHVYFGPSTFVLARKI